MTELEILKKQFEDKTSQNLKDNLAAITDIIVESFGEQYREIITKRIKEINLLIYIDNEVLESATARKDLSETEANYYNALLKEIKEDTIVLSKDPNVNRINNQKRRAKRIFKVIGTGDLTEFLKDEENYRNIIINNEDISQMIKDKKNNIRLDFAQDEKREYSLIVLPFLKVSDKTLIHEILHLLGFNEQINEREKSGLVVFDSYEDDDKVRLGITDIDEYYVEKKAIEIQEKMKEKGIAILPQLSLNEYSSYKNLDNILGDIIKKYDWLFAKATFTTDRDILKEVLGEDLLRRLATKVYENGNGTGYCYIGKYGRTLLDDITEDISRKVGK